MKHLFRFSLGLFLLFISQSLWAMDFSMDNRCFDDIEPKCQTMIIAVGIFTKDSPNQFADFAKNLPPKTYVLFSSRGGDLDSGLKIGRMIRARQFNTIIGNTEYSVADCLSACAYAFLGGVQRKLPPTSHLGLHHYYSKTQIISAEQKIKVNTILGDYLENMGIDRRLLEYANSEKSTSMTYITERQAKEFKIN